MSVSDFKTGYWYALELKKFAKEVGVPQYSKLRKDELESVLVTFFKTGKIKRVRNTKNLSLIHI